jgi:hypothetical protein
MKFILSRVTIGNPVMKIKCNSVLLILGVLPLMLFSQFGGSLREKPGTFEILRRTDYAAAECGFSKADVTANLPKLIEIVTAIRKNPVLSDIKGFNGRARIYNVVCYPLTSYGVPARISFEFSSFFKNKNGEVVFNAIEPPCWSLFTNQVYPIDAGFRADIFDRDACFFTVPLKKRTIQPGIDLYGDECIVIYDASRPDYWIPVTVEEAFSAARAFNNKEKDPVAAAYLKQFLDSEYAEFEASDLSKPAFFGGNLSRVSASAGMMGQDSIFPRIMKVNPAYWNKSLPKSAVQFITLRYNQDKTYLKKEYEDCLKHTDTGTGCDLSRFEYLLSLEDVKRLLPLIGE